MAGPPSPRSTRSLGTTLVTGFLRLAALTAVITLLLSARPAGHATVLSPEQRQLQRILAHRHYWEHRLSEAKRQEDSLERQLTSTQGRLSDQRQQLESEQARAAAEKARLMAAITADELEVSRLRGKIDATRAEYTRVHAEAAKLLAELRRLKAKIHRELGHVRDAVVQMYDMSQVPPLEQVLEARSLTDLLKQQSFVAQIGDRDRAILVEARNQRERVYRIASVYIQKMKELKALQAQEQTQLKLVVIATRREDVLLLKAQRLTERRQASMRATEASIQSLAEQEQQQLQDQASAAQTAQDVIEQDQQAAERVAFIIGQETGVYPYVGGAPGTLSWPVMGPMSQPFGPSPYAFEPPLVYHGVSYPHFHTGIDIAAPYQSPIHAAATGRVIFASLMVPGQPHLSYGLCVIIMHNSHMSTLYAHLDNTLGLRVHVGQIVSGGQVIGYEGVTGNTTGPHLHFEVRIDGQFVNPLSYLPRLQG